MMKTMSWRSTAWILLAAGSVFLSPAFAGDKASEDAPELPSLYLAEVKGTVHLIHDKKKGRVNPPQKVEAKDRILTGKKSSAYLQFKDGGTIEIGPDSDVEVGELDINPKSFKARFLMAVGRMRTVLKKLTRASSSFEIEAGGVVAGVRGTTFEVNYDKKEKQVATKTFEGSVYTRVGGEEKIVEKGFSLLVGEDGAPPILNALTNEETKEFVEFLGVSDDLDKKKKLFLKRLEKSLLGTLMKGDPLGNTADAGLPIKMPFGF